MSRWSAALFAALLIVGADVAAAQDASPGPVWGCAATTVSWRSATRTTGRRSSEAAATHVMVIASTGRSSSTSFDNARPPGGSC
jgi:hypothetical protein